MASTAAALNGTLLVAAVFLVLLHSSAGRQSGPALHCPDNRAYHCHDDNTEEPPAPTPMPSPSLAPLTPTPTPTPPPPPAQAPAVDCSLNCSMQCSPLCQANMTAGIDQCQADAISGGSGSYDICTANMCPDNCCQGCGQATVPTYLSCVNYYNRAIQYCMINCQDACNKNCTQG
uniref:Uncharacterized protein n=1 Tax=Setaria viridis TaxID=4556 RepID=A0A4U6VFT0_SETVI|nr:hypothetical protein SEVIR_3G309100v2 [Setaria viridis]